MTSPDLESLLAVVRTIPLFGSLPSTVVNQEETQQEREFLVLLVLLVHKAPLEPEGQRVNIRFLKTHDFTPPAGVRLQFDPETMLIRWGS